MRLRSRTTSAPRLRLISAPVWSDDGRPDGTRTIDAVSFAALETDGRFASTLAGAASGDEEALAALYRLLHPRVVRFLRAVRTSEADDIASVVWLDVVRELPRFDGDEAALVARALTIAHRRARERPLGVWRRGRSSTASLPHGPSQVTKLPRPQAEVLMLRVLGGMSVEEVARATRRSRASVRILQRLALRALARGTTRDEAA